MQTADLRKRLKGLPLADLRWMEETGSTNADALRWAEQGAADAALVAADSQTAGRGRLGRAWVTRPGAALAFSLVLRPDENEKAHLSLFSPLGALGVVSALETLGLKPEIKWPNDVLLGRRKTCGILAEAAWSGDRLDALVLGIGVNIAPSAVPPAQELLFPATCVEEERKAPVERFDLLYAILEQIFAWRQKLSTSEFMRAWQEHLAFQGETVFVSRSGQTPLEGRLEGLDAQGGLRLALFSGEVVTIQVGDVSLRPHI